MEKTKLSLSLVVVGVLIAILFGTFAYKTQHPSPLQERGHGHHFDHPGDG